VLTGFGRTGRMFACEHAGVSPDILCLSKALTGGMLPLAATLATDAVHDAFLSDERGRAFLHGHSYTANPLACAIALESLALLEEGGLARVARIEAIHEERLAALARRPEVACVRSIGLVAALDVRGEGGYLDALGPLLLERFLERGVLLR